MTEKKNDGYSLEYSAREQQEIRDIRSRYIDKQPEESSLELIRRLDAGVYNAATATSISVGVIGTLVMGSGMSLVMTEIGAALGAAALPLGVAIGLLGIGIGALAYPVYLGVLKRRRSKVAPEILKLSEELLEKGHAED